MYNFTHAPDMEGYTIRMTKVNVKQGRKSLSVISLLSFNLDMGVKQLITSLVEE